MSSSQIIPEIRCCPAPDSELWSMHPRVYFTPDAQGKAICPYCGAQVGS